MMERIAGAPPLFKARIAGVFYLLNILTGASVAVFIGRLSSRPFPHQQPGVFRILLPPDRLPHFPVDLPASNSGRADGAFRFGVADVSIAVAGKLSAHLH